MSWIFGKYGHRDERIEGKTAVVTGSTSGIGYHTALELYKRGGAVILAGRSLSKLKDADQRIRRSCTNQKDVGQLAVVQLDLSSLESVRSCAQNLLSKAQAIHILVNNAGVVLYDRELSEDGNEMQFATNHLGHFLLTLLLLPRLIKSAPSRIINVTSEPHCIANGIDLEDINREKSFFYHTVYSQTKLANILFSNELVRRLNTSGVTGVTVYSVNPGAVYTKMSDDFASMILPGVQWLFRRLQWMVMQSPARGATTTLRCAVGEVEGRQTGLYYTDCKVAVPPKSTRNEEKAKQLWDLSIKMAHLEKNTIDFFTPA